MDSALVLALGLGAIFVGVSVAILALAHGGGQRAAVGRSLAAIDALDRRGPTCGPTSSIVRSENG